MKLIVHGGGRLYDRRGRPVAYCYDPALEEDLARGPNAVRVLREIRADGVLWPQIEKRHAAIAREIEEALSSTSPAAADR